MYSQEMKYENFRLVKVRCLIDLLLKRGERQVELQNKVREDFTITEKGPIISANLSLKL